MKRFPIIFLLISFACSDKPKYADETLVLIDDLKDTRNTDSLLYFLRSENPIYRREAALAFGSVQDSLASLALGNALLEDTDGEVRRNAAFALGQTGGVQAVNALIPALEDKERAVVREALEALGKSAGERDVLALTQFESADTLLQEGKAWGLYRIALRGKGDTITTMMAARFLGAEYSFNTRLAAAHYFARSNKLAATGFGEALKKAALEDKSADVRMAAAAGLKHLAVNEALTTVASVLRAEGDYRVKVNAIRVCQNFLDSLQAKSLVLNSLSDPDEMVRVAGSETMRRAPEKFLLLDIQTALTRENSIRVKANLYATVLRLTPEEAPIHTIREICASQDSYGKAALFFALGEARLPVSRLAFETLASEMLNRSNEKVILTSAAAALVSINRNSGKELPATEFLEVYKKAIAGGDAGVIGIVCSALTDEKLPYKTLIKDLGFLYEAKSKLKLPKDIESIEPLERAIAYLEGKERPKSQRNEFNHPIDWKFVSSIENDQKAEITTEKGAILIRLLVDESPGSVANFIDLVNKKYFDGRFFHRVVPNFVAQDGCNRGDGFGSEDYSIRSEFSLRRYSTGSVGMASAGKDTEGTQWFITHSPTPHLDGRYTIFAEVVSGMEIVHRLDVGDKILEVKLK